MRYIDEIRMRRGKKKRERSENKKRGVSEERVVQGGM